MPLHLKLNLVPWKSLAEAFLYKASMKKFWEDFKAHFKKIWPLIQAEILKQLKGEIVKVALRTFLKSGAGAGFQVWLVTFIAEEFADEIAEPIVKAMFTRAGYTYRKIDGKIMVKKLEEAQESGDEADYNSTVDDILS